MGRNKIVAGLLAVSLLGGCGNLPTPDYFSDWHRDATPVTAEQLNDTRVGVDKLITHIECEILNASNLKWLVIDPRAAKLVNHDERASDELARNGGSALYVAQITLTLKVEDNGGVTPSLSFLDAYTAFTFGINGNLNVDRQRTFTTTYWISLNKLLLDASANNRCPNRLSSTDAVPKPSSSGPVPDLSGNLGIDGIIAGGLAARGSNDDNSDHYDIYVAPQTPGGGAKPAATSSVTVSVVFDPKKPITEKPNVLVKPDKPSDNASDPLSAAFPTFGSTVQFAIAATLDAGPTWSLKRFKGPSGSKGIFNGGRTGTDTLVIAFSPAKPTAKTRAAIAELKRAQMALDSFDLEHHGQQTLSPQDQKARDALQSDLTLQRRNFFLALSASDNAEAIAADQSFTNNMILQNLAGTVLQ